MADKRSRAEWERPDATLTTLPDGVLACEIVPWLDPTDVCALATTCRAFWARRSTWAEAWAPARLARHESHKDLWKIVRRSSRRINADWFFAISTSSLRIRSPSSGILHSLDRDAKKWPLAWFSQIGRIRVVRELLPRYDAKSGESFPLRCAAKHGHLEVVRELLPISDVDAFLGDALFSAVRFRHAKITRLLLEHGAEIKRLRGQLLGEVILDGDTEMIQILIEYGVVFDETSLICAAKSHLDTLRTLLQCGVDVEHIRSALIRSIKEHNVESVRIMLPYIDIKNCAPVIECTANYATNEMIRALLPHFSAEAHGQLLCLASIGRHVEAVRTVLSYGDAQKLTSATFKTAKRMALLESCMLDHIDVLQVLLHHFLPSEIAKETLEEIRHDGSSRANAAVRAWLFFQSL